MATAGKIPSDDHVGEADHRDDGRQTAQQKAALGNGGESGRPEPKSPADWAARGGASPAAAGTTAPAVGGSSQGHSDKKPA